MRSYFLGYIASYAAASLATGVLMLASFLIWILDSPPLMFDIVCGVLAVLPVLGLGVVFGRRKRARAVPVWYAAVTLTATVLLILATTVDRRVWPLTMPGYVPGYALQEIASLIWGGFQRAEFETVFHVVGGFLPPVLYHLGWLWAQSVRKVPLTAADSDPLPQESQNAGADLSPAADSDTLPQKSQNADDELSPAADPTVSQESQNTDADLSPAADPEAEKPDREGDA